MRKKQSRVEKPRSRRWFRYRLGIIAASLSCLAIARFSFSRTRRLKVSAAARRAQGALDRAFLRRANRCADAAARFRRRARLGFGARLERERRLGAVRRRGSLFQLRLSNDDAL